MHQTVDSLVLNLSSFCPHFVLAWIRSVYTNKRLMTVQSDLHSEALLEYSVRRTILVNLFPLPHWSNYGQSARRVFRNVAWGIGPIPDTLSFQTLILWQKYGVRQEKSEIWENWGNRTEDTGEVLKNEASSQTLLSVLNPLHNRCRRSPHAAIVTYLFI